MRHWPLRPFRVLLTRAFCILAIHHARQADKAELTRYRSLEREHKTLLHWYYARTVSASRAELAKLDAERETRSAQARERHESVQRAASAAAAAESAHAGATEAIRTGREQARAAAAAQQELAARVIKLELELSQARADRARRREEVAAAYEGLQALGPRIVHVQQRLAAGAPAVAALQARAAELLRRRTACERELMALYAKVAESERFRSQEERDQHLRSEAEALRASSALAARRVADMERANEAAEARAARRSKVAAEASVALERLRVIESAARRACEGRREDLQAAAKERVALLDAKSTARTAAETAAEGVSAASMQVQRCTPRSTTLALRIVRIIVAERQLSGFHGLLIENISADEMYATAIETVGGMQLFNFVVDTVRVRVRVGVGVRGEWGLGFGSGLRLGSGP